MVATGELALLPMIRTERVSVIDAGRAPARRPRPLQQPHLYRLPPRKIGARLAYGPGGHTVMSNSKGRIIDLHI